MPDFPWRFVTKAQADVLAPATWRGSFRTFAAYRAVVFYPHEPMQQAFYESRALATGPRTAVLKKHSLFERPRAAPYMY